MISFFSGLMRRLLFWGMILAIGWYCGNRYGAPESITQHVDKAVDSSVAYLKPKIEEYIGKLRNFVVDEEAKDELDERTTQLNAVISDPWIEMRRDALPPLREMSICPMVVSNAPLTNTDGEIIDFRALARLNGVELRVAPLEEGCLSSGFGRRGPMQKMHRGLDYFSDRKSTEIVAPADGVIIEAGYRDDYGIQIVLDHGRGVFTRLAHLETLHSGIEIGRSVRDGVPVGLMGDSGKYNTTRHLHYEILVGDYNTAAKSFGLRAVDPFTGDVDGATEIKSDELR